MTTDPRLLNRCWKTAACLGSRWIQAGLLALACATLAPPAGASAADPGVDVTAVSDSPLSLTTALAMLEDPGQNWTVADVQSPALAQRFETGHAPAAALGLGFTRSAWWLRLTLRNPADQAVQRMLVVENPTITSVQLHQEVAPGVIESVQTGSAQPFATRPYANRNFVFPLTLPAHSERVLYLRVASDIGLLVPVQLWTPEAFHTDERDDYVVQAWYFGIATAMVLFNLMLFIALRDRIYLQYVVFVGLVVFSLSIKNGLAPEYLGVGWQAWPNLYYYGGVSLALATFVALMRRMLNTAQQLPRVDRGLRGLIAVYLVLPVACAVALPQVARIAAVLFLATAVLTLGISGCLAWRRQRAAYFFIAAFAMLLVGGVTTTLRAMGILPTNAFTVDSVQFGSALEMLLLAFALADRFNTLRREKAKAQRDLLHTQQLLVDSLRSSERLLEQRVSERTEQLQALNARLESLSMTDGLTGIANRRQFDIALQKEWGRAQRLGQSLALAVLDVDWFKDYNDHYGHQSGDECLRQIAQLISQTVGRTGDLVARYGGEEFVFIAPGTDGESALAIANKVREALQALALPHVRSPLGRVTISIGVAAAVPGERNSAELLLHGADQALYRAKAEGRNQARLQPLD